MLQPQPAQPGTPLADIDTPALILDLDAFESNLDTARDIFAANPAVRLRPHAKTHKSAVIAHQQIKRGAIGQCVQKVAEAEALAWAGVTDILISNEIVGPTKLRRLAALARIATITVCVDSISQVQALQAAASQAGVILQVLIEINVGGNRCGIDPANALLPIATKILNSPNLRFHGIQAYQGSAQHLRQPAQREQAISTAAQIAQTAVAMLREQKIPCPVIAGAGTGTFPYELQSGIYNELQLGSYIFMDADYSRNTDTPGLGLSRFRQSLFVLSTVMSAARPGVTVVDAGHKALPTDSGLPVVHQRPGLHYADASDEHGKLTFDDPAAAPSEGEKLLLIPGHCDPTVDCYDWYVGIRKNQVECLWPITARGAMT